MQHILVVGQVPPPVHGQAIMIEALLRSPMSKVRLHHVPMAFSRTIDQVGRFAAGKILHLFLLIFRIIYARFRHRATTLYYPPAGPDRLPMYRDLIILLSTRWLFRHIIFHFHAGGLTDQLPQLSRPLRWLFHRAYGRPDCAIHLTSASPPDGYRLNARRAVIIPNGIPDASPSAIQLISTRLHSPDAPAILFVGSLRPSKGVTILLEAARLLKAQGLPFRIELMGDFFSAAYQHEIDAFLTQHNLCQHVRFLGVLRGQAKYDAFARAQIFCFPSFYECENLPVVIIEAMQFALPVVAARWRGIPALVEHKQTGLLIPPQSIEATADALARLLQSPTLRAQLGQCGREVYLRHYTLTHWSSQMEQTLLQIATENAVSKTCLTDQASGVLRIPQTGSQVGSVRRSHYG